MSGRPLPHGVLIVFKAEIPDSIAAEGETDRKRHIQPPLRNEDWFPGKLSATSKVGQNRYRLGNALVVWKFVQILAKNEVFVHSCLLAKRC